jgi:hypothetical protein
MIILIELQEGFHQLIGRPPINGISGLRGPYTEDKFIRLRLGDRFTREPIAKLPILSFPQRF